MNRNDRIKLSFTRNWKLPGKDKLTDWLKPSALSLNALKNSITWLTDEPIALYTSADNYIEWRILTQGTYEIETGKLIQISLKPGYTALDIGANIGLQSIRMSLAVGLHGKVLAFEPLHFLQEKLQKNLQLNRVDNVKLLPFALADVAAEEDFKISTTNWNQGTFTLSNKTSGNETQRVSIKVADDLDDIKTLERLDLIKIDVEGFELKVLQGLQQTLKNHKPRIIFEYDSHYWARAGSNIEDAYDLLNALDYSFYQVTAVGCLPVFNAGDMVNGNIFCLPG